jgi:hypothetical protein
MSLLDSLMQELQGGGIDQLSRSTGLGADDVTKVVSGSLPVIMGALTRNSGTSEGAGALLAALDRDHDGSVLDDITGFLGSGAGAADGAGILRHALGQRQGRVENALSTASGVDPASVAKILAMVAPLVMGALGKAKRQQGLDPSGLASMLGQEREVARQRSPQSVDLLTKVLDADDDGSVMDEVAQIGSSLLGSLFKR